VYSTHGGRVRQPDERPGGPARPTARSAAPDDGTIRIFRERGGRNGKVVTVIRRVPPGATLLNLAAGLKRLCRAGGTVKEGAMEIQGDHRARLADHLRAKGYTVKLAGG
jgi:translation initiation factor 1